MPSVVYVLTHQAMPGLVKIGFTAQEEVQTRLNQLYTTALPFPFELAYACRIETEEFAQRTEQALHIAFGPSRVNPRREFFRIEPEQAIAILKLLHVEGDPAEMDELTTGGDAVDVAAAREFAARRPNLNFEEMGIPVGSVLQFTRGPQTVTVLGPKSVDLDGESMFLTAATQRLLGNVNPVRPAPFWTFNGRPLSEIYEETYPREG